MKEFLKGTNTKSHDQSPSISFWSFITVSWLTPILQRARKGISLTLEDDIYNGSEQESAAYLSEFKAKPFLDQVSKYLANGDSNDKPDLMRYMFGISFKRIVAGILVSFLDSAAAVSVPFFMRQLILVIEDMDGVYTKSYSYMIALLLFMVIAVQIMASVTSYLLVVHLFLENIVIMNQMIIQKKLKLSQRSKARFSNADIMNLIQTEVPFACHFNDLVSLSPPKLCHVIAQCCFLYLLVGLSFLIAAAVIVVVTASASYAGALTDYYVSGLRESTNLRVSVLREFLQGIRLVKLQAREDNFKEKIVEHHRAQFQYLNPFFCIRSTIYGLMHSSIPIIAVFTFLGYSLMGGSLSASIIFPALILFDICSPIAHITDGVQDTVQSKKPLKTIEDFLLAEESNQDNHMKSPSAKPCISLKLIEMQYASERSSESSDGDHTPFSLQIEELIIDAPSFYGIEGPVGSGKSTLLKALLHEVTVIRGSVKVGGRIAYCAQEPWIMQSSIEKNIVFGSEYDMDRLSLAIECCGLKQDLLLFPNGIKTEIGESGVNLSGGQKSRVALARAVYSNADIYLLDNPLAACDAKVSWRIFSQLREVLKDKIVLMVSNSPSLLAKMDYSIQLEDGQMKSFSPIGPADYEDLDEKVELDKDDATVADSVMDQQQQLVDSFVVEEDKKSGRVKSSLFVELMNQAGMNDLILFTLLACISLVFSIANPLWLNRWAENTDGSKNTYYLIGYAVLGLMDSLSTGVQLLVYMMKISVLGQKYHLSALDGLFNASMTFFDTNPMGRMLNRMNADVVTAERVVGYNVSTSLSCLVTAIASVAIIIYSSPYMVIMIAFIGFLVFGIGHFFIIGMVEQNRLVPIANSDLYSTCNEILEGTSTIVAFRKTTCFTAILQRKQDSSFGAANAESMTEVWMRQRVMMLAALITLAIAITSCIVSKSSASASIFGLALVYSTSLASAIHSGVYQFAYVEGRINSFERLRHYAKDLSYEKVEGTVKVEDWPLRGEIELDSVQVAYDQRPDHLVIKNLTLTIKSGEKIGICGRTGCGKSTLISSLFRLIELKSGMIKIDGVDISQLDLKTLRKGMQIIPQDPILFTGSIRSNLGSEIEDVELWEALERVGLKDYVQSLEEKLDSPVDASGSNMSFGQRQLMCLARAFLAKPVILVMDEATASIDQESDERVQSIIKRHFQHATILSIAHRLESIADFDKILVLDQGELVEFDTPSSLLSNPQSAFSQLVDAAGPETQAKIRLLSQ